MGEKMAHRICALVNHMVAGMDLYPRRARRDASPLSLFDVVRTMRRSVPLSRLIEIEDSLRPYLAAILVDAIRDA